eukprot:g52534.t1
MPKGAKAVSKSKAGKKNVKGQRTKKQTVKHEVAGDEEKKKVVVEEVVKKFELEYDENGLIKLPDWMTGTEQASRNIDVLIDNLRLTTPTGRPLLNSTELKLVRGRRYGLVGQNGIGKSTLLDWIATKKIEGFPHHLEVFHVKQEQPVYDKPVLEVVLAHDVMKRRLEEMEEAVLEALEQETPPENANDVLDQVYDMQNSSGLHESEAKAKKILEDLGFSKEQIVQVHKSLSGGWRMRVALACALYVYPDILLLDEPTNHLDFPVVIFLREQLKVYPNTLVVVTHDRTFLNEVATDVIDFRDQKLTYYRGDYNQYIKTRAELRRDHERRYDAQQKQIHQWKAYIERFKGKEGVGEMVASRTKSLANMELIPAPTEEKEWRFSFPVPEKLKNDEFLVRVSDVSFDWNASSEEGKMLLNKVTADIDLKSRIGLMGANGAGKSTLINIILGKLEPLKGKVKRNEYMRYAVFTQHHMDQLDPNVSPMELLQTVYKEHNVKDQQARNHLGAFGLGGDLALQLIRNLSGGQKSRVAFALLTFLQPHLIIMDEPTNHLDLDTIEALIDALGRFEGGVLLVSHDQYFLEKSVKEFWGLDARGKIGVFHEEFDDCVEYSYKMPEDLPLKEEHQKKKKKDKNKDKDYEPKERREPGEKRQGAPKVPKGVKKPKELKAGKPYATRKKLPLSPARQTSREKIASQPLFLSFRFTWRRLLVQQRAVAPVVGPRVKSISSRSYVGGESALTGYRIGSNTVTVTRMADDMQWLRRTPSRYD